MVLADRPTIYSGVDAVDEPRVDAAPVAEALPCKDSSRMGRSGEPFAAVAIAIGIRMTLSATSYR